MIYEAAPDEPFGRGHFMRVLTNSWYIVRFSLQRIDWNAGYNQKKRLLPAYLMNGIGIFFIHTLIFRSGPEINYLESFYDAVRLLLVHNSYDTIAATVSCITVKGL